MWSRLGELALRCAPWTIAQVKVGGVPGYVLTRDGDEYEWCGLRLTRARYFDSAAAAKAAAESETQAAKSGTERPKTGTEGAGDGTD